MLDFVCVGDATRDLFLFLKEKPSFDGGKIPVEKIAWCLGGNAANVSVGLSRLGIQTNLITIFGDDDRGAWIKRELGSNGVNLEDSITEQGRESNLSTIMVVGGERTIFSYHSAGQKDLTNILPAKWVYLTSSPGNSSQSLFGLSLKYKKDNPDVKIAFNPYVVDLKKGESFLQPILEIVDVLILNKEEQTMLGMFGPKITVVTDGANGAAVYENGNQVFSRPAVSTTVVETTGAGDAFSSGFLAGLYYNNNIETALNWGLKNSASVVSKIGGIAGLLAKKDLDAAKS